MTDRSLTLRRLSAVGVAAVLAGCTQGTPSEAPTSNPYAADIAAVKASASGEFERKVLADNVITRAEYEEAMQVVATCMRNRGFTTSVTGQGSSGLLAWVTDEQDDPETAQVEGHDSSEPMRACQEESKNIVNLYVSMTRNPSKVNEDELITQCLIRKGVVPASFTAAEYRSAQAAGFANSPIDGEDQRVGGCWLNPSAP